MSVDSHEVIDHGALTRSPQEAREFEAAVRLRDRVKDLLDGPARSEWTMSPGELDNVFIGTFAKGTKTYRAGLLLCDRGYGEQAAMLNRSLFEHAVVSWWLLLCLDDEEAVMEALRDHRAHARVLFDRAMERHPELDEDRGGSPFEPEYIETLDGKFGDFGRQWHNKRLDELVREVEAAVDERYQTLFWKLFRFVNHHNNYMLHHSAVGIAETVVWEDPNETPSVKVGPDRASRNSSLWAAVCCYGLLTVATLRRLSPTRADGFSDLLDDIDRAFIAYRRDQVKDVGRNDPCPCGSGEKFKRCHGPWVR